MSAVVPQHLGRLFFSLITSSFSRPPLQVLNDDSHYSIPFPAVLTHFRLPIVNNKLIWPLATNIITTIIYCIVKSAAETAVASCLPISRLWVVRTIFSRECHMIDHTCFWGRAAAAPTHSGHMWYVAPWTPTYAHCYCTPRAGLHFINVFPRVPAYNTRETPTERAHVTILPQAEQPQKGKKLRADDRRPGPEQSSEHCMVLHVVAGKNHSLWEIKKGRKSELRA
jgi:hypothetical protein